ncbi:MAG: hypothetical protein N2319_00850 [Candidatus Kapabacteria bacterium]|nr:hypothetical protein [Candidatus Kapabacteria bacterium]
MKFKLKIFLFFLLILAPAVSLYSQQFIRNFGIKSEISFLNYNYNFKSIPNIPRPEIPLTISNNKPVLGFGGLISFNLTDDFFLSSSLLYSKSELDFQDLENVTVIVQGEPIDAIIRHNLETDINNLEISLSAGYRFFKAINLSFGIGLNFPISTYINQNQTIISPENLNFVFPIGNHEGKINNLSSLVFVPKATFSLDENKLSIGKIGISPEISFKFSLNSYLTSADWKFSAITAGVNLLFINKTEQSIRYDTTLTRDTITNFSTQITTETLQLRARNIIYDTLLSDNSIAYITNIKETYERQIPKPLPILNGELKTVFVSDDGTESVEQEIEYIKNIYQIHYFEKRGKQERLTKKLDTISSLNIPFIRFYPSAFSEAGLQEWQIKISSDNQIIKTFLGYDATPKLVNWYPYENNKNIEFNDIKFKYEFIIKDYEEQEITVSTGEINFKKSLKGEKINKIILIAIEPTKINDNNFKKLFSNLRKQKKVVLYYPFLTGVEDLIKPDFITEKNEEMIQVISRINNRNNLIIIGII